jgi:hypothetical protein
MRGMERDEGVLIKWLVVVPCRFQYRNLLFCAVILICFMCFCSFDSIQDGSVAVMTPHTGFEDPTTPKDAPLRESIELRALVFYD